MMTGQQSDRAGQEQDRPHTAHGHGHGHGHHGHHRVNGHAKATININSNKKGHGHHHHNNKDSHNHHHQHHNNHANNNNNNNSHPPANEHRMSSSSASGLSNDHFQIPIKRVDPPKSREQKFQSVSMKELLAKCNLPPPITLEPHTCVEKALKVLSENRILSAPVKDPMGKLLGLVDVMDIMKHCLNAYCEDDSGVAPPYTQWCQDPEKIRQRAIRYALKPVRSLIGLSGINPACPVYETGDMYQLAEVFARGVRRVPVVDHNDDKLIQVVSQSTLVKYIHEQRDWLLPGVGGKSLEDLKLAHGPTVVSMHVKATAIQAYFLMLANKVSACAVVDGHNVLMGNLSASDLRDMSLADLPDLLLTCEEFLAKRGKCETRPLITCGPNTKLEECVRLLADHKVHRVWVVDDKSCPVGVVSLTDILRVLVAPEDSPMEM